MKLIIAGDFAPTCRVAELINRSQYKDCLGEISRVIKTADYAIVNLECPILDNKATPISKCGPCLYCTKNAADAIHFAGFNCVTLANNHFYDYGEVGVKNTLSQLDRLNIEHVGGGLNLQEAGKTLYKEICGQKLAIINCCEHEFSIATNNSAGSNPLSPIKQYYTIQLARKESNFVIVIVHGGIEQYELPSPRMKELYHYFIDCGADVVVNHHQHCFSGYEIYQGKPIVYGLGNFCFDEPPQRNKPWNYGYMVEINTDDLPNIVLHPYIQCNDKPSVKPLSNRNSFDNQITQLNAIIANDELLQRHYNNLLLNGDKYYQLTMEPYTCRVLQSLYMRNLLPSFAKRKICKIIDYVYCESHSERLLHALNSLKTENIRIR